MHDLDELLSIPTESRKCDGIHDWLVKLGGHYGFDMQEDKMGNLYFTKGTAETYPCVVAHMDTVHDIKKGGILPVHINGYITGINPLTMTQTGIGGDDKCGVWAAVHCLRVLDACKAVFFVDEEIGCQGSGNCHLEYFKDCRFILQADRRGNRDFVNSISGPISSDAFQEAMLPFMIQYGYDFSFGMMTDVMRLTNRGVGISTANLSAGYYNPHWDNEYICEEDLARVCAMMESICREVKEVFRFEAPKVTSSWNGNGYSSSSSKSADIKTRQDNHQNGGGSKKHRGKDSKIGFNDGAHEPFPDWEPRIVGPQDAYGSGQYLMSGEAKRCEICGDPMTYDGMGPNSGGLLCIDCEMELHLGKASHLQEAIEDIEEERRVMLIRRRRRGKKKHHEQHQ